jgi:hypothetical protein
VRKKRGRSAWTSRQSNLAVDGFFGRNGDRS